MASTRTYAWIAGVSLAILGLYAAVSLSLPRGETLGAFGNIVQCLVPLLANAGLLLNAGTPHWRRNVFWMLAAMSCTLWMIGQFQWTYYEVYLHQSLPDLYPGDIIFFLRGVPLMAALALRPHLRRSEMQLRFGYLDFVANIQNLVTAVWFGVLWLQSRTAWRTVYAHLFGADVMYMLSSLVINVGISLKEYHTGSLYDLPLVASFLWFAAAGLIAYKNQALLDDAAEASSESEQKRGESSLASRLALA